MPNSRFLATAFAMAAAFGVEPALADNGAGGFYMGIGTSASFYEVDYDKAVDSRDPANRSANAGRILFGSASADEVTWDVGVFGGYRLGGPVYLDIEADFARHTGKASGHLPGEGSSPGRNQLGEVWPENWSLAKDRSHGLTLRLGVDVPSIGTDLYVFGGIRRLHAEFRNSYTGCLSTAGCEPGQLTAGSERHDEKYDGWTAGVGVEKTLGNIAIRGEFRYADHGTSRRTVRFDDVAVTVPVALATNEIGVGIGLLWRP